MGAGTLNLLPQQAQDLIRAVGTPGVLAAGVLAFCAMFWFTAIVPARDDLRLLETRAARMDARAASERPLLPPAQRATLDLKAFLDTLPNLAQVRSDALGLHVAAEKRGLRLESGEYRLLREDDSSILRYQLRFQVKGAYVAIRSLLAESLEALPAMGLDEFSVKRESLGADIVTARIQFTIFMDGKR